MGNCLELFKGIVEFFRGELKKVSQNRDTALTKVTINVYNDLQIYNAFVRLQTSPPLRKCWMNWATNTTRKIIPRASSSTFS